jgi:hypothetical protein
VGTYLAAGARLVVAVLVCVHLVGAVLGDLAEHDVLVVGVDKHLLVAVGLVVVHHPLLALLGLSACSLSVCVHPRCLL